MGIFHVAQHAQPGVPAAKAASPRRSQSRRWDNVLARPFRPLVTGAAPDAGPPHPTGPGGAVLVPMVPQAQPFTMRVAPRTRIGSVPKLAPGHQGRGLGQPIGAGFQTLNYVGFTPLENSPSQQPNRKAIDIPRGNVVAWTPGQAVRASYKAHDFAPATRFSHHTRSAGMWAQSNFPPQQRTLTQPVNQYLIRNASNVARRQVPAGQVNAGLYTIGYPTRADVAAHIGGGPIAVLGGGY